jgi:glycosyltransferase involved in cell wall biosynthesis
MSTPDSNIKISTVIPAFNAERFLPRCLASVFAQTLKSFEVIVVDDGSTDNTAGLAAELGATVAQRKNGGLSAARNTGIQVATGEWIALLDADDLWAPQKLERQVVSIRPDTVLVYTGITTFNDNGVRVEIPAIDPVQARKVLRYRNPIIPSTALVRRDAVTLNGGFREDIRACEDWEMWVRLKRLGQFEAVVEPLLDYYIYPGSLSANPGRMLDAFERILDTTLVADLDGCNRWSWKQRIRAVQLASAGLIARDNGLKGDLDYMFQSLRAWPSPFFQPQRFLQFAVSLKNALHL